MSTQLALFALLEQALNRYLRLDPDALSRLQPLHGRLIRLHIEGLNLDLYLIPDAHGIQLYPEYEGSADCTLSGTPLGFARLSDSARSADELFQGHVKIDGDTEVGQVFGSVLAGLDIDWEESLSRLTGDVVAHQIGNSGRAAGRWLEHAAETLPQDLKEYLQEEARLLPGRYEYEEFAEQVETLRDDAERLQARVRRLQSFSHGKSETGA
jgi:ubiquinone biosynthesis protein UbiJ